MKELICISCQHKNRIDAKFCANCRTALPRLIRSRYLVQTINKPNNEPIPYPAVDKRRCGACGEWIDDISNNECPGCNISPYPPQVCYLYQRATSPTPEQANLESVSYWFYEENPETWWGVMQTKWVKDWFPNGQRVTVTATTDRGQVCDLNEDALLVQITSCSFNSILSDVAVLAVADGIGGHDSGEVASKTAVTGLLQALSPLLGESFQPIGPDQNKTQLQGIFREAILQANRAVFAQHQATGTDLGTTLTAVWLVKGLAIVANVGDSRTYLYRAGNLQQITKDHSLVYRLMETQQISRDEIYTHPDRNQIYRNLGDKEVVEVDTFAVELEPDDLLVLCCDGLWEMVRDEGIEQILANEENVTAAGQRLVQLANKAGGEDNISLILARIQPL